MIIAAESARVGPHRHLGNFNVPFKAQPRTMHDTVLDLMGVCTRHNLSETARRALFSFLQRIGEDVPDYATACNMALAASSARSVRLARRGHMYTQ